ncbi:MAG: hypothetical protein HON70_23700, partial [Lentisphaerae bacterium]|nr:hypothetical protein [Lentisphaerota bacterium]
LFITLDVFHQEHPDKTIGPQGSVRGAVVGKHLAWLEKLLTAARKDARIKHIFVQSHLPAIHPVRKVNSSGMLMDRGMKSELWKTMRKHKVDIYFAGEVHANTLTKDPESNLVQLVSRGNFFRNLQTVDVTDDRVEITCYNQTGSRPADGRYEKTGRFVVDKSGGKPTFTTDGELAFLDPKGRLFHFTFEEDHPLTDWPVMGLRGKTEDGSGVAVRGQKCTRVLPNKGAFGRHYSALSAGIGRVDGVHGKAGAFSKDSRMAIWGMGPLYGEHAVSYALWLKTTSDANQVLINSCSIWGNSLKGFLNLHLNGGLPEVVISKAQRLLVDAASLSDGKWHHLAAVMPQDGCELSEVKLFIDGKAMPTKLAGKDQALRFNQAVRMSFGGFGFSRDAVTALGAKPYEGALDDPSIWARSLSAKEVTGLAARGPTEPKLMK